MYQHHEGHWTQVRVIHAGCNCSCAARRTRGRGQQRRRWCCCGLRRRRRCLARCSGGDKALKFANQPLVHSAPRTIFISATLVAAAITNNCIAIENPLLGGSRKKGPVWISHSTRGRAVSHVIMHCNSSKGRIIAIKHLSPAFHE